MSSIGDITEVVNNEQLLLQVVNETPNPDEDDTFILMQDCRFNLDRPISRQVCSGGGLVYFFGSGDNSIDFTLLLSTPEMEDGTGINELIGLTKRNASGALTSQTYKIKATNVSGASKTITCTGVLPHLEIQRMSGVGGVVFNGRLQLTGDTVTVAS